jgi:hypothetical protein
MRKRDATRLKMRTPPPLRCPRLRKACLAALFFLDACAGRAAGPSASHGQDPTLDDAAHGSSDAGATTDAGNAKAADAGTATAHDAGKSDAGKSDAGACATTASRWTPMSLTSAPQARAHPIVLWTGSELLVFGSEAPDGGLYSPCTDAWRAMPEIPVNTQGSIISGPGRLFFENSAVNTNDKLQQMAIYDFAANAFHLVPKAGAMAAKGQAFAFANMELIAWGGATQDALAATWVSTNLGARYSIPDDRWSPMATEGAPPARLGEGSAVWTGTRFVVWGGISGNTIDGPGGGRLECSSAPYDGCMRYGDGAYYTPQLDRWTSMSGVGAPVARSGHVLVGSGNRILVWGGHTYQVVNGSPSYRPLVDGGLYDPEKDTWIATAAAPFDADHMHDAALWSGSRLVVFAEQTPGKTGWIYDPSSDRWMDMASAPGGCPAGPQASAQAGAIIELCGRQLGRFDPVQNRWTLTDLPADAPPQLGSVTWTGTRWFVWGGYHYGPLPPNPCRGAMPMPGTPICDPPGPTPVPTNQGWTLVE